MKSSNSNSWALVLGGSSGFGLATAKKLATEGYSICIVHRDRKGSMEGIEKHFEELRKTAPSFFSLNTDALSIDGIQGVVSTLRDKLQGTGKVQMLLHSIAYGNLKPVVPPAGSTDFVSVMEDEDMARTIYAMGTSLLTWVQKLHSERLFATDASIFGLTSEGNEIAWRGYGAVAAAKSALESLCRTIAVEFAPYGLRCNVIQPGVTDTPALRLIPGNDKMKASALARNPFKRLTTPEDVADVISLLCRPEARWINGTVLRVDGGEHIASS